MKQMMKYTFAIVTLLLVSLGAKADGKITVNGTVVYDVKGTSQNAYTSTEGTVSASIDNSRVVTLTITPAEGYFVMKDNISAVKTIDGSYAQTRTPGVNTPLDITGDDIVIGPTAKTYTFTMPDNAYDVEVTVDFLAIIDITNASITLSETSYTYDGTEKKPSVSSVKLSGAELNATYYTIGYSNNTNAGTATVTVTGSGIYKNAATATFTIEKAPATITFETQEVVKSLNDAAFTIQLTNTGDGTVSYESSNTNVATVNASSGEVSIQGGGEATITATVTDKADSNYNYAEKTASFMVRVENLEMEVTVEGYTGRYDGQAHGISITVKTPEDATIKYGTQEGTYDLDASPTYTNAGSYTVYYQITKDKYKTVTGSATVVIERAEAELAWTDEYMGYVMGTSWWGPRLLNPNNLKIIYESDNKRVATIDQEGKITAVGPGDCLIKAIFEGDDNYEPKTVSYVLEIFEEYKLWIGSTQVTSDNHKDILGDGHFFYDKENKWLVITSNTEPKVIESRMSDLTIYINGGSKLERIWFNNEGNAENTGKLYFTSYMNIPGSIDFSTSDASGVISGFSSIGLDEDAFLYLLDPTDGSYSGGKLVTKDGATAQVATIGQYLKPLANGSTVTFPSGKYDTEDLTNKVIDNILNTLIQHTGDSDEDDDYFDSAESAIILNNLNTTSGITLLMENVEKGELIPGSEEYAVKFRGGLTFMVPDGEGTITLNVKTEAGYKLMLMIGQSEPKEIVQTEQGEVSFDYNVEKPTYCCLYLVQDAATSRGTRIGKRDKHHGSIQSVRVLAQKSSLNPLGEISGFPDSKTPEVEIGSEETTGIKEIKIDNTTNDPVNDDNRWFDMQGRQIEKPTKAGIYIQNKRKVIVK